MIVTECVVALLGALAGTYTTPTVSIFKWQHELKNYVITASVDSTEMEFNGEKSGIIYSILKNHASITGSGSLRRICPVTVTKSDCKKYSPSKDSAYYTCMERVRENSKAILFSKDVTHHVSMTAMNLNVAALKREDSEKCFSEVKKKPRLTNLPSPCTDAIIKELLYKNKIKLKGKYGCAYFGQNIPRSIIADRPLIMALEGLHHIYKIPSNSVKYPYFYYIYTTDGFQILRLHSWGNKRPNKNSIWIAKRVDGVHEDFLSFLIKNERKDNPSSLSQIMPWSSVNAKFEKCPVRVVRRFPGRDMFDMASSTDKRISQVKQERRISK